MKLDIGQIIAVAQQAGFVGEDLTTAVSIALAESGGNPQAYNPETAAHAPAGKGSFGLWQIYLFKHPEYEGQDLYDPQINAAAAYAVYAAAGHSFRPWSTFGNHAYVAYLDSVSNAINSAAPPQDVEASSDVPADPTADTSSETPPGTPGTGEIVGMAIAGALTIWAAYKFIG